MRTRSGRAHWSSWQIIAIDLCQRLSARNHSPPSSYPALSSQRWQGWAPSARWRDKGCLGCLGYLGCLGCLGPAPAPQRGSADLFLGASRGQRASRSSDIRASSQSLGRAVVRFPCRWETDLPCSWQNLTGPELDLSWSAATYGTEAARGNEIHLHYCFYS